MEVDPVPNSEFIEHSLPAGFKHSAQNPVVEQRQPVQGAEQECRASEGTKDEEEAPEPRADYCPIASSPIRTA